MKTCSKCGLSKAESEFFVKDKLRGRLHAQCKTCYQLHRQTYYKTHYTKYRESYLQRARARREKVRNTFHQNLLDYLANKACAECGENDIRVLEFDHLDPREKVFSVSQATKFGYSWEQTLAEIQKCRILCANCHKRRTASQFNWYKNF